MVKILFSFIILSASIYLAQAHCGLPGGRCPQDPKSPRFQKILKIALDDFNSKEKSNCDACDYEANDITNVSSQVVAGSSWKFTCVIAPTCDNGVQPKAYDFTVWMRVGGLPPEVQYSVSSA